MDRSRYLVPSFVIIGHSDSAGAIVFSKKAGLFFSDVPSIPYDLTRQATMRANTTSDIVNDPRAVELLHQLVD